MGFLCGRLESPLGEVILVADREGRLRGLGWADREDRLLRDLRRCHGRDSVCEEGRSPRELSTVISAYFAGDLAAIDALEVDPGGTPFQRLVWTELRRIPAGATATYAELAHRIGRPTAVRAVGAANGANPISLVIPCHRLVGADGALTGYGGGLERKHWLLAHEGAR